MSGGRVALTAVGDDPPDAVLRKAPLRIQRRITLELDACFTVKVLLIQLPASQESELPFHLPLLWQWAVARVDHRRDRPVQASREFPRWGALLSPPSLRAPGRPFLPRRRGLPSNELPAQLDSRGRSTSRPPATRSRLLALPRRGGHGSGSLQPDHLDGRFRGNDRDGARVWWLRQSESVCATNLSSPVPSRANRIWSPRTRAAPEPYSLCCGRGSRGLRSAPAKPDAASPIVTSQPRSRNEGQ